MYFSNLRINQWQQFENVDIDFHNRLTILTGANGSGKTTILNILAKHYGWEFNSLATPKKESKTGVMVFYPRLFNGINISDKHLIGSIDYSNGTKTSLQIQNNSTAAQYQVLINQQQGVNCFYIPSHRSLYRYQPVSNIPTAKKDKSHAFTEVTNVVRQRYHGGNEGGSSSFFMKSILIGWVIQGYGVHSADRTIMPADDEQIRNFEGFQEVLRNVLPESLGFEKLDVRNMEIVFICNGGRDEFLLETASGGISVLIDMAWQIYMYTTKDSADCTVMIDEVENHLHPTMQRQILPSLVLAFPNTKFIVSTHSPLVVGSVRDSAVYVLRYNGVGKIVSEQLELEKKARTASEVLDEVLGVSVTMPIWAEKKLEHIIEKYQSEGLNSNSFGSMRYDLAEAGLEQLMPSALRSLVEDND